MSSLLARAGLAFRTARYLRPAQIAYRARLRASKAVFARVPPAILERALARGAHCRASGHVGWPTDFEPLDARLPAQPGDAEHLASGRFRLLSETRCVPNRSDWEPRDVPQLWRFHLHYFEWAWAFAAHPDWVWASAEFRRLWRSWQLGTRVGRWDAWSPYVASVRAWVLCGLFAPLVAGTEDEDAFRRSLAAHASYVRANLELDVGGNHLLKNVKALAGLGVFLGDDSLVRVACRYLARQIRVQVLDDGGHFERSPSYHAQVLGDLRDLADLLDAAGSTAMARELEHAADAMTGWLATMLMPDGEVPLLNDCAPVGLARLQALGVEPDVRDRLTVLEPTGYIVARPDDRLHLVFDAGPPCPPELPAHAHADTLSFELAVGGRRIVVDTGTSTYQDAARRQVERSTAAHNTVEVDDVDSTEVWSTFRAARRANAAIEAASDRDGTIEIVARHDGYHRLPGAPTHRRRLRLTTGRVEVHDDIFGGGGHSVIARIHAAPEIDCRILGPGEACLGPLRVRVRGGELSVTEALVAQGFGHLEAARCLVVRARGLLPIQLETVLEVREPMR